MQKSDYEKPIPEPSNTEEVKPVPFGVPIILDRLSEPNKQGNYVRPNPVANPFANS